MKKTSRVLVDRGSAAHLDGDAELVGDDVRERGLAESGRPAEQDVLHRLVAPSRRFEQDAQVAAHLLLAHVLGEQARTKREVELLVVGPRVEDLVHGHFLPRALSAKASAS